MPSNLTSVTLFIRLSFWSISSSKDSAERRAITRHQFECGFMPLSNVTKGGQSNEYKNDGGSAKY